MQERASRASPPTRGCRPRRQFAPSLRRYTTAAGPNGLTTGRSGDHRGMPKPSFDELIEAMKAGAAVLQEREIPFAVGGGLAAWAHGGPRSQHDVDFMIPPERAEEALEGLAGAGRRVDRPPEGWLFKAWHPNGALIALIFAPAGGPLTAERIEQIPISEVVAL